MRTIASASSTGTRQPTLVFLHDSLGCITVWRDFPNRLAMALGCDARETLRTTDLRQRLQRHHEDRTDAVTSAWIDVCLSPEFRDWNIERYLPSIRCPVRRRSSPTT